MTTPSYSTGTNTGIAFDFSPYFERIATAAETVATNTTTIATNTTTIATNSTTIATKITTISSTLTSMEADIKILSDLGKWTGIHVISPYEWFGYMAIYRLFVEHGKLLDMGDNVSETQMAEALAEAESYFQKIKDLPTFFQYS